MMMCADHKQRDVCFLCPNQWEDGHTFVPVYESKMFLFRPLFFFFLIIHKAELAPKHLSVEKPEEKPPVQNKQSN